MKKERFYYGEQFKLANLEVLMTSQLQILGSGSISNITNLPRISICGIWDTETNKMSFGVARCSYKDSFDKSIGRNISRKRANETPFKIIDVDPNDSISDQFLAAARDIETEVASMSYPIKLF